jgi:hypothetical protein
MASLGSIPSTYQRVFYLGKELKSGGRSLEALGVGCHGINVIHVHNNKPREGYPLPANRRAKTARKTVLAREHNRRHPIEVVDLATDDDDDNDDEIVVQDDNDEVCIIDITE